MDTTELNIGREATLAVLAQGVMAVLGFAGIVIFIRSLGSEPVSVYYFLFAVAEVLSRIPAGVTEAVRKRISEVQTTTEEYFGLGLVFYVGYTTLVAALIIALAPSLKEFGLVTDRTYLYSICFLLFAVGLFNVSNQTHAARGNPSSAVWFDAVRSVFTLGAQLLLIGYGWSVHALLIGLATGSLVTAALVLARVRIRPRFPKKEARKRVRTFANWSVPNAFVSNMYNRIDVLVLGSFVRSGSVANYTAAHRLSLPAVLLSQSISGPLNIKSSGLSSAGESVLRDLENALAYTGLLAIPMFFGALAIPETLMVTIFGPSLAGTGNLLVAMTLFQVIYVYRLPFDAIIRGTDQPRTTFVINSATLLVNIPLAIALGVTYGTIGVIVATIVAELLRFSVYQLFAYRWFNRALLPDELGKQFTSALVMFAIVEGVTSFVTVTSALWLLVVLAVAGIAYFGTLIIISTHFRNTAVGIVAEFTRT